MKTKYATQVFSRTVAAAIRTAHSTNELKDCKEFAESTTSFFLKINNLFDIFNVKYVQNSSKNPYRGSLHAKNQVILSYLNEVKTFLKNTSSENRFTIRKSQKYGIMDKS